MKRDHPDISQVSLVLLDRPTRPLSTERVKLSPIPPFTLRSGGGTHPTFGQVSPDALWPCLGKRGREEPEDKLPALWRAH